VQYSFLPHQNILLPWVSWCMAQRR